MREAGEELAVTLRAPRLVEQFSETIQRARIDVHVVAARIDGTPRADGREIGEIGWFSPDATPADATPLLMAQLRRWIAAYLVEETP